MILCRSNYLKLCTSFPPDPSLGNAEVIEFSHFELRTLCEAIEQFPHRATPQVGHTWVVCAFMPA